MVLWKDIFKKDEYPQFFIVKYIKNYLSRLLVSKRVIPTVDKKASPNSFIYFWSFIFWDWVPFTKMFYKLHSLSLIKGGVSIQNRIAKEFNSMNVVNIKLSLHNLLIYVPLLQRNMWSNSTTFFLIVSVHLGITP